MLMSISGHFVVDCLRNCATIFRCFGCLLPPRRQQATVSRPTLFQVPEDPQAVRVAKSSNEADDHWDLPHSSKSMEREKVNNNRKPLGDSKVLPRIPQNYKSIIAFGVSMKQVTLSSRCPWVPSMSSCCLWIKHSKTTVSGIFAWLLFWRLQLTKHTKLRDGFNPPGNNSRQV